MRVLVVNAGSSSLKLRVLRGSNEVVRGADLPGDEAPEEAIRAFVAEGAGDPAIDASGHRIVHGGSRFAASVAVDDDVVGELERLSDLAPLHNPPAVAALKAVRAVLGDLPAVACFDTAFHATIPAEAATYGIPWRWTEELGVRRFGFHGLSHAYASRRAAELVGRTPGELRVVTCHLGAGASVTAVAGGVSVDTTMGFTPLEGLVMATRSGSVDPGALLWLQERLHLGPAAMAEQLERHAGLLGTSGVSGDMRAVLEAAAAGERRAALAAGVYVHRARAAVAAMAAAMDGLDALVFTGGVGEASAEIRARVCGGLGFLGVELDPRRNVAPGTADADLATAGSTVRVLRIGAREDLEIAREVRRVLGARLAG